MRISSRRPPMRMAKANQSGLKQYCCINNYEKCFMFFNNKWNKHITGKIKIKSCYPLGILSSIGWINPPNPVVGLCMSNKGIIIVQVISIWHPWIISSMLNCKVLNCISHESIVWKVKTIYRKQKHNNFHVHLFSLGVRFCSMWFSGRVNLCHFALFLFLNISDSPRRGRIVKDEAAVIAYKY